jgi:fimbrial protein FimW
MNLVKIIIDDENNYFSAGLRYSISEYAKSNNKKIIFLTPGGIEQPDIVIASSYRRTQRWRRLGYSGALACVITIQERLIESYNETSRVLYRTDDQERLFELLTETLSGSRYVGEARHPGLTCREKEVMGYLRRGFGQSQTARVLGVSVKTIHSHKRSVMNKLMLNRHHDFLGWLLLQDRELFETRE